MAHICEKPLQEGIADKEHKRGDPMAPALVILVPFALLTRVDHDHTRNPDVTNSRSGLKRHTQNCSRSTLRYGGRRDASA
jgi:hypothetical protein